MSKKEIREGGPSFASFHEGLLSKRTSCGAVISEELSNIEAYDKRLNGFITVFSGTNGLALTRARAIDAQLESNPRAAPPLLGLPLTIKDNIFFGGFPTTNGSEVFRDFVPSDNAPAVDWLLAAGCVPLGKTNMHELALGTTGTSGFGGPIRNPVDPSRISGGSSGGSAVSVAMSKQPMLSLGSDTGGSVRVPAALCGVSGFKPSFGVLSTEGVFPLSGSLDHVGLMARSVGDIAMSFRTIVRSKPIVQRRYRVGVPDSYFVDELDSVVSRKFWRAVDLLKQSASFDVKDVKAGDDYREYVRARATITYKESSWFYESVLRSKEASKKLHADVFQLMSRGLKIGMITYMRALNVKGIAISRIPRLLRGVDVLIMPTCPLVAPRVDEVVGKETGHVRSLLLRNAELFNLSGMPALSLPIDPRKGELAVGLQAVGRIGEDERVLAASELVSRTVGSASDE